MDRDSDEEEQESIESEINKLFPEENALLNTDSVSVTLSTQLASTRLTIRKLELELGNADLDDENMTLVQEHIGDLFTQINHLRSGATESEVIVKDITRDIKTLDSAKRNIVASITAVKRYQMLENGLDQFRELVKKRKYGDSAQSLLAIKQLQAFFKTYTAIQKINTLFKGIQNVQATLRAQVMADFEAAFNAENEKPKQPKLLADACLAVDALGQDAKHNLLNWYSNMQLKEYRRIFRPTEEAGQLDNVSRRYAWFRRVLKHHQDDDAAIFPADWLVGGVLTAAFSAQTRDDLKSVLTKLSAALSVGLLMESLHATTEFEKEMSQRFNLPFDDLVKRGTSASPLTAASISSAFESYLSIFVDAQNRIIGDMISNYRHRRSSISEDSTAHVLPSSTELFYFYRETLEKCAGLSTKTPFLDLCGVYKKWLKTYSEEILGGSLTNLTKDSRRSSTESRPNLLELNNACLVVNTGDYCADTAAQLEERLKERIQPELKDRVSLEAEKDMFLSVISSAITTFLRELELTVEPAFQNMLKSPWKEVETVSSESSYVRELSHLVDSVVSVARQKIEQRKYVRNLCDRIVGLIVTKFLQTLVRCRPISTIGAEQILLDVQGIRSCLLRMPQHPGEPKNASSAAYTRYINKSVGRIESLLKGIMTAESPPEEFVKNYLILIPCQSFSDFQKMLDLKGVRRTDQNALLDVFLAKTSTMNELADSSFLSSLDMDPNPSISLAMPNSPSMVTNTPSLFSSIMLSNNSRDGGSNVPSRVGTPNLAAGRSVSFGDAQNRTADGSAFRKLGTRLFG